MTDVRATFYSLYAPADSIAALDTADKARAFFRRSFRSTAEHPTSVIELMGEDQVVDDFMKGRRGGLTQVSVDPVAYPQGRGVLVGDAAHAMGQSLGRVSRARQLQCLQG
jgi:2-polyprenyl-6-methoxyphenol hydroxylase-like FAD-dependent oxidoreductase